MWILRNDVDVARRKVDSLQNTINDISNHIASCERANRWDLVSKVQLPGLFGERLGLEATKAIADRVLAGAKGILVGAEFAACKAAVEAAQRALDGVQLGSDDALKLANKTLKSLDEATNLIIQEVQKALAEVGKLGQLAVDRASAALVAFEKDSVELLRGAKAAIDALASCHEWLECEAAKAARDVTKAAGSALIDVSKFVVEVVGDVEQAGLEVARWMISNLTSLITITDVSLSAEVGKGVSGLAFLATVKGTVGGDKHFDLKVSIDLGQVEQFLRELFNK